MKVIVINNPAAKDGGALTVLKEVIHKISTLKCDRIFHIFVTAFELKKYETKKIKIYIIKKQNLIERILWDNIQFKIYLKNKNIYPDICLSLQNTGVNLDKKILQILFFHQGLSIVNLNWKILNKKERKYWIYENIYPIFIVQYLKKIKRVIVQTNWVKEEFSKKFGYNIDKIFVLKQKLKEIETKKIKKIEKNKFRIFYPATPLIYKNHKIIIELLYLLKKEKLEKNIECIFTFNKNENIELDNMLEKYKLENTVKLIGKISYEKVLEYYNSSDLLIFPSCLETLGLPLIEAQQFNMDIMALELPYSKDAIGNYKKITFIKSIDPKCWKEELKKIISKGE